MDKKELSREKRIFREKFSGYILCTSNDRTTKTFGNQTHNPNIIKVTRTHPKSCFVSQILKMNIHKDCEEL